jgi:uncharacterized membrane protein
MFGAIYLLAHGAVKIFLVVALLQKRMWAYPTALVVFGAFAVYELYRYTHTHSPVLLVLMAFELFVIWLIWREYGIVKTKPLVIGQ